MSEEKVKRFYSPTKIAYLKYSRCIKLLDRQLNNLGYRFLEVVAGRRLVVVAGWEVAADNIEGIAVVDIAAVGIAVVEVPDSIAVVVAENPSGYWSCHNTPDLHLPHVDLEVEQLDECTSDKYVSKWKKVGNRVYLPDVYPISFIA